MHLLGRNSNQQCVCTSHCPASFPLPRFAPGKLQVELMQSQNLSQDLGKGGVGLKLLFKHDQTALEDCSGTSINLH